MKIKTIKIKGWGEAEEKKKINSQEVVGAVYFVVGG